MCLTSVDGKVNIWLFITAFCVCKDVLLDLPSSGVFAELPKACAYLRCKGTEQCVSRKFWCKNPPCPSMLYCSKSRKESLKGPSSCEDVRCSKGFVCHVRARHCRWDGVCDQQIARCVSERDYFEGPTSCIDFQCAAGRRCILRESLCVKPPCKLLKSCAEMKDFETWLQKCKNLGCQSEHDCFLRRPDSNCSGSPCTHTPDCTSRNEQNSEMEEQCRGWVCPKGQVCSVHSKGPCKRGSCKIFRSCHEPLPKPLSTSGINPIYSDDKKLNSSSERISEGSHSRPPRILLNRTFSEVVKPTAISLTTWLNHLKLITGIEAVETWMVRANRQENHQEFLEWLKSVKDMLGPGAYDLWLEEVRAMAVTNSAFQKWLPSLPANRSTDHLVQTTVGNVSGLAYETFSGPENSNRTNDNTKYVQAKDNRDTARLNNDDIKEAKYVIQAKNETPAIQIDVPRDHQIPTVLQQPMGINDWYRLYHSTRTNFQLTHPLLPRNFGDAGPWRNPGYSYEGIANAAPSNPSYPKFSSNWSFAPSPDDSPVFPGPKTWQDHYSPSAYQWRQMAAPRDDITQDRRVFAPPIGPSPFYPSSMETPMNFPPRSSTDHTMPWIKSFNDRYDTSKFAAPGNLEAYPIAARNLEYPNRPESGYSQSLSNLDQRGTELHDHQARKFAYNSKNVEDSTAHFPGPSEDLSFRYPKYPRRFEEPRLPDDYQHILDYSGRNLYEKGSREGSPLPTISRNHRVDVDRPLSTHNPRPADNKPGTPQSGFRMKTSYPHDQLHGITETRSPSSPIFVHGTPENHRRNPPSHKPNLFHQDDREKNLFVGDRANDVPGQTMDFPDFWNLRYRNPTSSFLRTIPGRDYGNRGTIENRPSVTNVPPIVLTSGKIVIPRVVSSKGRNVSDEKVIKDDSKNFEDYSTAEDVRVYPLMLSLQGYIQSQSKQVFQDFSNPPKNSTILPVYTIDNGSSEDYYNDDYEALDKQEDINFFRDVNYGGRPDFPNNLKDAFEVEAALIMQNRTGKDGLRIKDIQWEYEYESDSNDDDPNLPQRTEILVPTTNVSSKSDLARQIPSHLVDRLPDDWVVNRSEAWNGDRSDMSSESDYYNEMDDYVDEDIPENRSPIDSDRIDVDDSSNHGKLLADRKDRFYSDTDHKTFKKNFVSS